jgi:phage protein D
METDLFRIDLGGVEVDDLNDHIVDLEVELDDELAALFKLRLAMQLDDARDWTILDDERLVAWAPITITAGFASGAEELLDGVITHLKARFASDPSKCIVEVWGMDRSALLDRVEVLATWPGRADSDIATEIFQAHGLTAEVDDTGTVHDAAVSTVLQRETDMQFLSRLAVRHGFDCYVRGETGYFQAPRLGQPPQPVLAAHFGPETTLKQFDLEVNATMPTEVAMAQLGRLSKETVTAEATKTSLAALGADDAAALLPAGTPPARAVLAQVVTTGPAEATTYCQSAHDRSQWFVQGTGEVLANAYGHVLEPRKTVTVKGVGKTHSGVYYVTHVTHVFTRTTYTQRFRVKRNALHFTGTQDFSSSGA